MKFLSSLALLFLIVPSAFATSTSFGHVRDVIKANVGNGFRGINNPADRLSCTVSVRYRSGQLVLRVTSYHPTGTKGVAEFTASTQSNELVVSDLSDSSGGGTLIYVTAGKYVQTSPRKKIDRRRLTLRRDSLTLRYMSRHNELGRTEELDCYRK
jgi:hypothetical protein